MLRSVDLRSTEYLAEFYLVFQQF